MKSWFLALLMAAVALALAPSVAEAKRFGGGFSKGMQRSAPAKPAPRRAARPRAAPWPRTMRWTIPGSRRRRPSPR